MTETKRANIMSFVDPVLDHVEERALKIIWTFEELDTLNIRQLAAVRGLIKAAVTETRKHFENATIGIKQ